MNKLVLAKTAWRLATILLVIGLPIAMGCSSPKKGDVTGKVTYKGEPLPYGSVQFMSPQGAFGVEINPDGTYSIPGVPLGVSKVAVTCQDPKAVEFNKALSAAGRDPKAPKPKGKVEDFDKIPSKFGDFSTSGLSYEVKSGPNTINIELKD